jgi:FixJ family two-component response regulator
MRIRASNQMIDSPLPGKVCVVDGDQGVQHSLRVLLRTLGFDAVTFSTAEEFLNHMEENNPAFLIIELDLPGMGGLRLQTDLIRRGIHVPVIGLTSESSGRKRAEASRLGFLDLVEKPFVHWSVVERVQQTLSQGGTRKETAV